jgi:hypothetical protein
MAYGRGYGNRSYRSKYGTKKKKKSRAIVAAKKARRENLNAIRALANMRMLQGQLGLELKHLTRSYGTIAASGVDVPVPSDTLAPEISNALATVQGNDISHREALKITVKSYQLKYQIQWPLVTDTDLTADATQNKGEWHPTVTVAVVLDKRVNNNTDPPLFNDIWVGDGGSSYAKDVFGPLSFRNIEKSKRFKILYQKTHIPTASNSGISVSTAHEQIPPEVQYGNFYYKCSMPVEYSDNLANISSIIDNNIYVFFWRGDTDNALIDHPHYRARTRIRFLG